MRTSFSTEIIREETARERKMKKEKEERKGCTYFRLHLRIFSSPRLMCVSTIRVRLSTSKSFMYQRKEDRGREETSTVVGVLGTAKDWDFPLSLDALPFFQCNATEHEESPERPPMSFSGEISNRTK